MIPDLFPRLRLIFNRRGTCYGFYRNRWLLIILLPLSTIIALFGDTIAFARINVNEVRGDAPLVWIVTGGMLMSAIALIGGLTALLESAVLDRIILPLVALAAGTLLGGAFFHMIPKGMESLPLLNGSVWIMGGFTLFLVIEQFLHWHHSHHNSKQSHQPFTYLILIGDSVHNFLGGLGIASTFLISPSAGISAWIAAAMHEVPQELGDFGVLIHGGWPRRWALFWNAVSALTFPVGAILAYFISQDYNVAGLVLLGAGNFIYLAASDLLPQVKAQESLREAALYFCCFAVGLVVMFSIAYWLK